MLLVETRPSAVKRKVEVEATNLADFRRLLLSQVGIPESGDVHVELFDPDFEEYVLLTDFDTLNKKSKIRIHCEPAPGQSASWVRG
jgi:hypothetical protein